MDRTNLLVYLSLLFLSTLIGFFVMPATAVDRFVNR